MTEKQKKAELLFLAIGTVDDRFVAETMECNVAKKRLWQRKPFAYGLASAAAVLLVVLSILGGRALSRIYGYMALPDESKAHYSLQHALDKAEDIATVSNGEDIDLFNGAKIIWQKEKDGKYYTVNVDEGDLRELKSHTASSTTKITAQGKEIARLWISFGDGTVVTPYLEESAGNVGYGSLFDYNPEVYPEYYCSDMVKALIGSNA